MQAILSTPISLDLSWSRWGTLGLLFLLPLEFAPTTTIFELESIEKQRIRLEFERNLPQHYRSLSGELAKTLLSSAQKHKIAPELILALMATESSFRPHAESKAGAVGLLQLLPNTAQEIAQSEKISYSGRTDLFNPIINLQLGVAYLAYLKKRFPEKNVYLAAYNFGPTAVGRKLRSGDRNFTMAANYVGKIRRKEKEFGLQTLAKQ